MCICVLLCLSMSVCVHVNMSGMWNGIQLVWLRQRGVRSVGYTRRERARACGCTNVCRRGDGGGWRSVTYVVCVKYTADVSIRHLLIRETVRQRETHTRETRERAKEARMHAHFMYARTLVHRKYAA